MKNKVIVALDIDDVKKAEKLVDDLSSVVGGFKIGPRLTFRAGNSFLIALSKKLALQKSILFFDHKFFDIPSTTVSAVKVAAELGAQWVTVHALNGPECLKELSKLQTEIRNTNPQFRVLAVTVLTSFSKATLPPVWKDETIEKSVLELASSAVDSGIDSFVCSPKEVSVLRKKFPKSFLVVPGIRLQSSSDDQKDDQKRTATPVEALKAGASALVIGRPIIEAQDPVLAAKAIVESL